MSETLLDARVVGRLPPAYVTVLDAIAAGMDDHALAEMLGVHHAAVPSMIRLAAAKLVVAEAELRRRPSENA